MKASGMKESIELSVMVRIIKKRKKENPNKTPNEKCFFKTKIERFSQRKSQGVI
jgi:hypothetical protein